jgi:genome maintenance exonuclease 1
VWYNAAVQLIQKYNYAELKRKEGDGRLYLTPEGEALPSVTTILSKTKDRSFLKKWRAKVGEEEAEKIIRDSAKIGTALHLYIERFVNGDKYKDLTEVGVQAEKMAQRIIDEAFGDITEIWGSEVHLYNPGKYAGTTDMVGVYKGRPTIIDFKQSNRPKKREWVQDYLMQLAAYAAAHNAMFDTEIEQGVVLMCSRDLTFQRFELDGEKFVRATNAFMKKLDAYNASII